MRKLGVKIVDEMRVGKQEYFRCCSDLPTSNGKGLSRFVSLARRTVCISVYSRMTCASNKSFSFCTV